jgi:UDP-N-acetylmuramoyl-tripeptide--D-alanyl-D-alanine ligase
MHQGAVMEGSWGSESTVVADAEAALELLRAELREGDVVLVKASKVAGLAALADALVDDSGIETGGQERSDRGIGTGGQERSDRGIGTGGQERSDRGIGSA